MGESFYRKPSGPVPEAEFMTRFHHQPVLVAESLEQLEISPGKIWVDATVGLGGHLRLIAEQCVSGLVIGIDRDKSALAQTADEIKELAIPEQVRLELVHANFAEIEPELARLGIFQVTGGILADLGVSSMQFDDAARGFSFQKDAPLDMRMDTSRGPTAEELVNELSEGELADIIYKFGEDRASRLIARHIVAARPLTTTAELAGVVSRALRASRRQRGEDRSHPATRTFQALRIAVNRELDSLEKFLEAAVKLLAPGARLAVISFHSLEDRMVKQFFKEMASDCICPPRQPVCTCSKQSRLKLITRKPLQPREQEVLANPRSRSAKLRVGEKLP